MWRGRALMTMPTGRCLGLVRSLALRIAMVLPAINCSSAEQTTALPIKRLSFDTPPGMTRADVLVTAPKKPPAAVLVLCPGRNGDATRMINDPRWRAFGASHLVALAGISFASEDPPSDDPARGYSRAKDGSGEILLRAIHRTYGQGMPMMLYGFSQGAVFAASFAEFAPECVVAWCAHAGGFLEAPGKSQRIPPGLLSCGSDDTNLGLALVYFKQGRAAGNHWLWAEIPGCDHAETVQLKDLTTSYFSAVLSALPKGRQTAHPGIWVDIDTKRPVTREFAIEYPALTGYLPEKQLWPAWERLVVVGE